MKITEQKFNRLFNIFIIIGMIVSVLWCSIYEFDTGKADVVAFVKYAVIATGAVMGVLNTVLCANGNMWNFLFGIIEVLICGYAHLDEGATGVAIQHFIYLLPMQFIGIWQWKKRGAGTGDYGRENQLRARHFHLKDLVIFGGGFIILELIVFAIILFINEGGSFSFSGNIDYKKILLDSLVVSLNITGQILLALAYMEQWYVWTVVNIVSILLWSHILMENSEPKNVVMLVKYVFYLANSINGIRIWKKLSKNGANVKMEHHGCC